MPLQPAVAMDLRLEGAAAAWRRFPVAAQPRPLVLTGSTYGLASSATDELVQAAGAGLLGVDASVPAAAVDALRAAGLVGIDESGCGVRVTSAAPGSMGYSTDRGGRQLPSWLLTINGLDGTSYVMDAESQALAFPSTHPVTVTHALGGYGKMLEDGLTLRVDADPPWLRKDTGPASTEVAVLESDAVIVFARPADDGGASVAPVTFALQAALGARVLCDVHGSPVIVARRKRPRSGR